MTSQIIPAVVAFLIGLAVGVVLLLFWRANSRKKVTRKDVLAASAASDYLVNSGINKFNVVSMTLPDGRVMLLVEAEPQKKLRFSHIIEHLLKEHIQRSTGKVVQAVYWRFPIVGKDGVTANMTYADADPVPDTRDPFEGKPAEERPVSSESAESQYEITEVHWDEFAAHSSPPPAQPRPASKDGE